MAKCLLCGGQGPKLKTPENYGHLWSRLGHGQWETTVGWAMYHNGLRILLQVIYSIYGNSVLQCVMMLNIELKLLNRWPKDETGPGLFKGPSRILRILKKRRHQEKGIAQDRLDWSHWLWKWSDKELGNARGTALRGIKLTATPALTANHVNNP